MELEIIVVDNCSNDGSMQMVRECFPEVHLIVNNQNQGYAHAVNRALQISCGNFILILNSDTVILPDALEKTARFMMSDPRLGIVGCKILNSDGTLQYSCRSFPSLSNFIIENLFLHDILPRSRLFGRPYMTYFGYNEIKEVDVLLGAYMMLKKEMVEKIGFFDDQFFMYSEEMDYCYRAKKANWKVCFYPDTEIIHLGAESTKRYATRMFIELHRSHHQLIQKYHSAGYLFIVKAVLLLGLLLRMNISLGNLLLSQGSKEKIKVVKYDLHKYFYTIAWYILGDRKRINQIA